MWQFAGYFPTPQAATFQAKGSLLRQFALSQPDLSLYTDCYYCALRLYPHPIAQNFNIYIVVCQELLRKKVN